MKLIIVLHMLSAIASIIGILWLVDISIKAYTVNTMKAAEYRPPSSKPYEPRFPAYLERPRQIARITAVVSLVIFLACTALRILSG